MVELCSSESYCSEVRLSISAIGCAGTACDSIEQGIMVPIVRASRSTPETCATNLATLPARHKLCRWLGLFISNMAGDMGHYDAT